MAVINAVCAEGQWMETLHYEPTPAWEHALEVPDCSCHLLLVARDGERVVGWCRVFLDKDSDTEAAIGIGLLAEYREQGLGTSLVRQAITWSRERGLMRLHLRTRTDNARAIHMFQKCGFAFSRSLESGWMEMECMLENCGRDKERRP